MSNLIKVIGSDGSESIVGAYLKSFYEEKNAQTPKGAPKPFTIEAYEEPEEEVKPKSVAVSSAEENEKLLADKQSALDAEKGRNDELMKRLAELEEMVKASAGPKIPVDNTVDANSGAGKASTDKTSKANSGAGK